MFEDSDGLFRCFGMMPEASFSYIFVHEIISFCDNQSFLSHVWTISPAFCYSVMNKMKDKLAQFRSLQARHAFRNLEFL